MSAVKDTHHGGGQSEGPSTDADNVSVRDPTQNVMKLVEAASRRIDDLIVAGFRRIDELRSMDSRRADELREAESRRVNEQLTLRADYEERLRNAEAKRIDAIRAVDVNAVAVASQRASDQATVLACVAAETPVLCADLIWRPAGQLRIGDELIALDEEPIAARPGDHCSRGRQYRRAIVTANELKDDALLLVTTPRGAVRCNGQHPWLTMRPASKEVKWIWMRADHLRPGDQVMHAVDVWEVDRSYEAGWLAGIMDGEGCLNFSSSPSGNAKLTIVQGDGPTGDAIREALTPRVGFTVQARKPVARRKPESNYVVGAKAGILKLLGSVRPARLMVNADQVWEGRFIGGVNRATVVTSVENAGMGTIASLSTSTNTYIAAGFAMHNTQVAQSAEALRNLVATTAATVAQSQQQLATTLTTRLTTLEQGSYQQQGRSARDDPAMTQLLAEVQTLRQRGDTADGGRRGKDDSWKLLVSVVGLMATIMTISAVLYAVLKKP